MLKLGILSICLIILQIPLTHPASILAFLVACALTVFGKVNVPTASTHYIAATGMFVISLAASFLLPQIRAQEGHNLFLVDGTRHEAALRKALPDAIYEYAKATFQRVFPPGGYCEPGAACWRTGKPISTPFAFTPEGAFQRPEMSRVVSLPNFEGPNSFSAGFQNATTTRDIPSTNWYDTEARRGDPMRAQMPFFVIYTIPASWVGLKLCTKGDTFQVSSAGLTEKHFSRHNHCRTLQQGDVAQKLYGLSIDPASPLSVMVKPTVSVNAVSHYANLAARILAVVALLFLLVTPNLPKLLTFLTVSSLAIVASAIWVVHDFGFQIFQGGNDPLTHFGFGQQILQSVAAGEWTQALRGGESVFYFMPGYRYFRALEMAIFGSTSYLSFAVLLSYPFALFKLASRMGGRSFALMSVPIAYFAFFQTARLDGWSEIVAFPLFVAALALLLSEYPTEPDRRSSNFLIAGLMMAAVCWLRPNLGLAAILAMSIAALQAPWRDSIRRALLGFLGFSAVGLMAVHNLYFGGRMVLATDAAGIKENLRVPPFTYAQALMDLVTVQFASPNIAKVSTQLSAWLFGPAGIPVIGLAIILAITLCKANRSAVTQSIRQMGKQPAMRVVLASWLGLQAPLLFYTPVGRYAYLPCHVGLLLLLMAALSVYKQTGLDTSFNDTWLRGWGTLERVWIRYLALLKAV